MATGSRSSSKRDTYVPKHAPSKARKKAAAPKRSFLRRRWWLLLLLTPLVALALGAIGLAFAYSRIQLPEELPPIQTTYLYDRNGDLITTLHGAVDRTIVRLDQISPHMIDATIATEDHDFYEHGGVDPVGLLRAAYIDLVKRDTVQGASTITQQLIKNVYAGDYVTDPETGLRDYVVPERSIQEKVREILLAVKLENELGKDEILARYLNTVYFGQGAYGIEAAARTYFDKPARRLSVLESATLAGVLHAPELYDPIDRPDDNEFRRDYALDQMARYGYIDQAEADRLKEKPCCGTVEVSSDEQIIAPGDSEYFVDHVRRDLFRRYGSAEVYGGGLRVTTTLDLDLQAAAEEAIETHLPDEDTDPAAALVALDVSTGQILAMAGGRHWEESRVNYATLPCEGCGRQAGSAFKAFTLATAMQEGYDLEAYWVGPSSMPIPGCPDPESDDGVWHPVNAEGSGNYSLRDATAHSVNTIFAQLISALGPEKVVDMAHTLGIRSDLPAVCSITLGSVAVNALEMTNAYATLADAGTRTWATPLLQVKDPSGKVDPDIVQQGEQVIAENDALLVTSALQGVVTKGTGRSAAIPPYPVAGKTGTANENVDAWFCGYTTTIATCVWIGYPEAEIPLENIHGVASVYGGTIPAAIWQDFMSVAMDGKDVETFPPGSTDGYLLGPPSPVPPPVASPSPCLVTTSPGASPVPCPSPTPSPTSSPGPSTSPDPSTQPSQEPSPSPSRSPTKPPPSPSGSPSPSPPPSPTP